LLSPKWLGSLTPCRAGIVEICYSRIRKTFGKSQKARKMPELRVIPMPRTSKFPLRLGELLDGGQRNGDSRIAPGLRLPHHRESFAEMIATQQQRGIAFLTTRDGHDSTRHVSPRSLRNGAVAIRPERERRMLLQWQGDRPDCWAARSDYRCTCRTSATRSTCFLLPSNSNQQR